MFRRCIRKFSPLDVCYGSQYANYKMPPIQNATNETFAPGSTSRRNLQAALVNLRAKIDKGELDVPIIIGGKEYRPGKKLTREIPFENKTVLHTYYHADEQLLKLAIETALEEKQKWMSHPFQDRAAILLKAAQLLSTTSKYDFSVGTMYNQSKSCWQSEIDCIAETEDFFRFGVKFASEIYDSQPLSTPGNAWNMVEWRPLEGFVMAISPFNFTAIGANVAYIPALMGNTVVWKPSDNALYSSYLTYKLLEDAGMPHGVVNFVPCSAQNAENVVVKHPELAAVNLVGSAATYKKVYHALGQNIDNYRQFPRLVAETGGKNFHLVHTSADPETVVAGTIRSGFELQGQKCSACSRAFFPKSQWPEYKARLIAATKSLAQGTPEDFKNFLGAVIDETAYKRVKGAIESAKKDPSCDVLVGGECSDEKGWFIPPTIIECRDLNNELFSREFFGPMIAVHVYDDGQPDAWCKIAESINKGAPFGLTGAIYANDRAKIGAAKKRLFYAAGNLYINNQSTGSVVGQQPFGGSRWSGTNNKPGSKGFVEQFVTPRTVKEALQYERAILHPHQL